MSDHFTDDVEPDEAAAPLAEPAGDDMASDFPDGAFDAGTRPAGLPEKFWDPATGSVRVDALAQSYAALERKLGTGAASDLPETPDAYEIEAGEGTIGADPAVNRRLHEAGFTQDQAQLVYALANEYVPQMVVELAADFEARHQVERLERHFGGTEKWQEVSRQLKSWGTRNLPGPVYEALSCTADGVLAMECMMASGEPAVIQDGARVETGLSENDLKEMMSDPRYWRENDPQVVERVRKGFRHLFPQ